MYHTVVLEHTLSPVPERFLQVHNAHCLCWASVISACVRETSGRSCRLVHHDVQALLYRVFWSSNSTFSRMGLAIIVHLRTVPKSMFKLIEMHAASTVRQFHSNGSTRLLFWPHSPKLLREPPGTVEPTSHEVYRARNMMEGVWCKEVSRRAFLSFLDEQSFLFGQILPVPCLVALYYWKFASLDSDWQISCEI